MVHGGDAQAAPGRIARGMERIAITGIGSVSPVGLSTDEAWEALLAGRSGIAEITQFDASDMPIRVAGEVKGLECWTWVFSRLLGLLPPYDTFHPLDSESVKYVQ